MRRIRYILLVVIIIGSVLLCTCYINLAHQSILSTTLRKANNFIFEIQNPPRSSLVIPTIPPTVSAGAETFNASLKFNYGIPGDKICHINHTEKIFLLVVVCSAVKNKDQRQAIRETWGSAASKSGNTGTVRLAFLLGSGADDQETRMVNEEANVHRDVIQANFIDTYRNLSYKTVALLQWITENCPNSSFILKSDDDTYVNIPNLVREASLMAGKKNVMFGHLLQNISPQRDKSSKWFISESEYSGKIYPDFLSGTAYAMTGDSVPKLYVASQSQPMLYLEDVFVTGICASKAGVSRLSSKGFSLNKRSSTGCTFRDSTTGHYVSITEMHTIWKELQDASLMCR